MNYKLSDFKVGQKAYIELTGNYSRGKSTKEELIHECTVTSIGKKYVTADGVKFEEHTYSYGGLVEHTDCCVNNVLYPNKQDLEDKLDKEELLSNIRSGFTGFKGFIKCKADELSLEKLRKINEIMNS